MLTNSKSYKGRCYCLKVGSKGFGEGQICSLGKKKSDLDKHCKVGEWISHIT